MQRAIDKLVLFEKYGEIKKHSVLPSRLYEEADLYLDQFEEGSIKIPLIGSLLDGVGARLNQFLKEPYEKAAKEVDESSITLIEQLDNTRRNIRLGNVDVITQKELMQSAEKLERSYAQTAVLKDLNTMLSPLRAKSCVDDTIEIINNTSGNSANYSFNHYSAKSFGKIVRNSRLAKPVAYTGILEGLKRVGTGMFPFVGSFISDETDEEMNLLVSSDEDASKLNEFNLTRKRMAIWACPLAVYESFDQIRGDIVFASFAE